MTGYSPIDFFRRFEAQMKAHMLQASKGFGFCSYATTQAATMAIKGMNGATLGTNDIGPWQPPWHQGFDTKQGKFLKVTIKKGEEQCPGKIRSMSDGKTLEWIHDLPQPVPGYPAQSDGKLNESMICHSRFSRFLARIQQQVQSWRRLCAERAGPRLGSCPQASVSHGSWESLSGSDGRCNHTSYCWSETRSWSHDHRSRQRQTMNREISNLETRKKYRTTGLGLFRFGRSNRDILHTNLWRLNPPRRIALDPARCPAHRCDGCRLFDPGASCFQGSAGQGAKSGSQLAKFWSHWYHMVLDYIRI